MDKDCIAVYRICKYNERKITISTRYLFLWKKIIFFQILNIIIVALLHRNIMSNT